MTPEERAAMTAKRDALEAKVTALLAEATAIEPINSDVPDTPVTPTITGHDDRPWYRAGPLAGIAESGIRTALGMKDLFTDLTPEEEMVLEIAAAETAAAPGGGVGKFAGDVAQMALPGGALKKAGTIAKGAFGTGVHSFIQPGDENRLGGALMDAGQAYVGGKVFEKALKGAKQTDAAKWIKNKADVYMTPAMATDSALLNGIESLMSRMHFTAGGTAKLRQKAVEEWGRATANMARPRGTAKFTEMGHKAVTKLKSLYKTAYDKAWKGANLNQQSRSNMLNKEGAIIGKYAADEQALLIRNFNKISDLDDPKAIDQVLRKLIRSRRVQKDPNIDLVDDLVDLRETFRGSLGEGVQKRLARVDANYGKYLTVKKAAAKRSTGRGLYTPEEVGAAGKVLSGETATSTGKAHLQDMASAGAETVEKPLTGFLATQRQAIAKAAPSPKGVMEKTGKFITGETAAQKWTRLQVQKLKDSKTGSTIASQLPGALAARTVEAGEY